jgi:hypothetical protein
LLQIKIGTEMERKMEMRSKMGDKYGDGGSKSWGQEGKEMSG